MFTNSKRKIVVFFPYRKFPMNFTCSRAYKWLTIFSTFLFKMFPGIVIRYVLKSMAYESAEARQKFPRLLQLVEFYPGSDVDAFKRKVISLNYKTIFE